MDRQPAHLSDSAKSFAIERLTALLGGDAVRFTDDACCYVINNTLILPINQQEVKVFFDDWLAVELPSGKRVGHLIDRLHFAADAFAFLKLDGPVSCRLTNHGEFELLDAQAKCRLSVRAAFLSAQGCEIRKNYPVMITREQIDRLHELLVTATRDEITRRFGPTAATERGIGATASAECHREERDIDTTSQHSGATFSSSSSASSSSSSAAARCDRDYVELILSHRPGLLANFIYYDPNYPIDRPRLDELLSTATASGIRPGVERESIEDCSTTTALTPCVGQNAAGFFAYSHRLGLWLRCSNIAIEEMLVRLLLTLPNQLTATDRRYLGKNSNSSTLRQIFAKYAETRGLTIARNSLRSIDLFVLNNGLLVESGTTLRPTLPDDATFTSSGWSYVRESAIAERADLETFLRQLFPHEDERLAILEYVAGLLDGHRRKKCFVVLTDRRQGNNGKSTFLKFLNVFFGEQYYAKSIKFISASAMSERNSHDSGLEAMNGKRLLVADEFTRRTRLDTAIIKDLVSIPDMVVQGRSFGKATTFKFVWQAGIIMAFNEGQHPHFDTNDAAFVSRMLVCNMRSRFVFGRPERDEPFTFPADANIVGKFRSWCSAFLDILLEIRRTTGDRNLVVPRSMIDARNELITEMRDSDDQLSEWLARELATERKSLQIGEILDSDTKRVVVFNVLDLYDKYSKQRTSHPRLYLDAMTRHSFQRCVETVCNNGSMMFGESRCLFKRRYQSRKNNSNRQRRNVIVAEITEIINNK